MQPLDRAIEIAGGGTALAVAIGVSTNAPRMWKTRGNVPAEHCPSIERATGVLCEELRPDVEWEVLLLRNLKLKRPRGLRMSNAARVRKAVVGSGTEA